MIFILACLILINITVCENVKAGVIAPIALRADLNDRGIKYMYLDISLTIANYGYVPYGKHLFGKL